ncbi:MAG TPA: NAD(P)/FAD-dependent oxidoreductase [Pseudolabrys sp.]|nr:NAD(P)/FAD-dependent oxidoreductase [Pseudolabrys sp.]
MTNSDTEVVIIGGGAAGIAAGRHLLAAGIECLLVEARSRLGGRAYTVDASGFGIDLGCGWLHSADRNPWTQVAEAEGRTLDRSEPPWNKPSLETGFPLDEQREFRQAMHALYERVGEAARKQPDVPVASVLAPGCRWNALLGSIGTYISGGELDHVSALDFDNYDDTGVNWRVIEGYGTTIAGYARPLRAMLDCPVLRIDHAGRRLRIETAKGTITADRAIVTLPTNVLAEMEDLFAPALPEKTQAAANLPLGLADKLFLSLDRAEEFEHDSRLFGRTDRATATYHLRPFGRPMIECYFGGRNAWDLEAGGEKAFVDFALSELTGQLGNDFTKRLKPITMHPWGADPFARGSYSYALPGKVASRAVLAAPVDGRLFFAGEACSTHDFSTAHGGFITGVSAAEQVIAVRQRALVK